MRVVKGNARITILDRRPNSWQADVQASEDTRLEAYLAYFPGWKVFVDGLEQPLQIVSKTGLLRFDVPAGDHRVELEFGPTPVRRAAGVLSAVFLLLTPWIVRRMSGH